jgi:hypothetical protein
MAHTKSSMSSLDAAWQRIPTMSSDFVLISLPAGYSPHVLAACKLHSLTTSSRLTHMAAVPQYIASARTTQKTPLPTVLLLLHVQLLLRSRDDHWAAIQQWICLQSRSLAMAIPAGSIILALSQYATILSFTKMGSGIQTLMGRGGIHGQDGDRRSLLPFFFQNKSRLKIRIYYQYILQHTVNICQAQLP